MAVANETALYGTSFLQTPTQTITRHISTVDFEKEGIPQYAGAYAVVLDELFSAAECAELISIAQQANEGIWNRALVDIGGGQQAHRPDIRNCGRIIYDDIDLAERIWLRVRPYLTDILQVKIPVRLSRSGVELPSKICVASGLNERLRFLSYGLGEYFERHFDGCYRRSIKDGPGEEFSMYTIHLYLNDGDTDKDQEGKLVGGSTSFFTPGTWEGGKEVHVKPKIGRVLVFQQHGLLHSGEEVLRGRKFTMRTDVMYRNSR